MDKRSLILVVAVVGSFVVAMALAAQFGGKSSGGLTSSNKKIRAKQGTQRKNARALISSRPSGRSEGAKGTESQQGEGPDVWGHIGKSRDEVAKSLGERLAQEALNAVSSEEGIAWIQKQLASGHAQEGGTHLYSALGRLEARMVPLDVDAVLEAFREAIEAATTPEEHVEAVYHQAQTLLQVGEADLALDAAKKMPEDPGAATERVLEIQVLEGIAQQERGKPEAAIEVYKETLRKAVSLGDRPTPKVESVYRQAALRLSRLYLEKGETRKAERVARDLRFWLDE